MPQELTYKLAKCCSPQVGGCIVGYFKEDGTIAVHCSGCASVQHLRHERLLNVTWQDIQAEEMKATPEEIDPQFSALDETDYLILKHHQELGIDYSIVVAETLGIPLEEAHQRHRKLREIGGLKRVEKLIIQYRKNIVKGKWIKHRNHTYYELTPTGEKWIRWFERKLEAQSGMRRET
jgi:hypothetical protein